MVMRYCERHGQVFDVLILIDDPDYLDDDDDEDAETVVCEKCMLEENEAQNAEIDALLNV